MPSDTMPIGLKTGLVELFPHQESWRADSEQNIILIKGILGNDCIGAQYIGSTAIIGMSAKPIIDIAIAVRELNTVFSYIDILEQNGIFYRKVEETGQLLFIKGDLKDDIKTHHIHIVRVNSSN